MPSSAWWQRIHPPPTRARSWYFAFQATTATRYLMEFSFRLQGPSRLIASVQASSSARDGWRRVVWDSFGVKAPIPTSEIGFWRSAKYDDIEREYAGMTSGGPLSKVLLEQQQMYLLRLSDEEIAEDMARALELPCEQ